MAAILDFQKWRPSEAFNGSILSRKTLIGSNRESMITLNTLPKGLPRITGLKKKYKPGEMIKLNCTSKPSYPVPVIKWFINEKPVSISLLLHSIINILGKNEFPGLFKVYWTAVFFHWNSPRTFAPTRKFEFLYNNDFSETKKNNNQIKRKDHDDMVLYPD
ncbi:hypothetical protein GQR58_027777 [Nymphon striatum]|nr:hypothetical protein GQR58_027777 [Nymphon striatum]